VNEQVIINQAVDTYHRLDRAWSFYFPKITAPVYILFALIHSSILIIKYPYLNGQ